MTNGHEQPLERQLARLTADERNQLVWEFDLQAMQAAAGDQRGWAIAAGDLLNHVALEGERLMGWNRRQFLKILRRMIIRELAKPSANLVAREAPRPS